MVEQELYATAFPTLDDSQIASLGRCSHTSVKHFHDGEKLDVVGDRDMKFFVVKSGEVEIVDYSGDEPKTVVGPSQGPVHRRNLPPDRCPGCRQRGRPGPLRGR